MTPDEVTAIIFPTGEDVLETHWDELISNLPLGDVTGDVEAAPQMRYTDITDMVSYMSGLLIHTERDDKKVQFFITFARIGSFSQ